MSFTRAWDFSAEICDLEVMTDGSTPVERSNTQVNTGSYSWKSSTLSSAIVMGVPDGTVDLRAGYFLWVSDDAGWGNDGIRGDMNVFAVHQRWETDFGVRLIWMEDERRLDLSIDGVVQDTIALPAEWVIETWFHIGITASYTSGYASAYFNGDRILNYVGAITQQPWDAVFLFQRRETFGTQNGAWLDDGYVDVMVGESDTAPPMYKFLPSYVLSAGADAEFTPLSGSNYQMVDDGPGEDGDTTYNKAATSAGSLKDTFNCDSIALPTDYILVAAHPFVVTRKLDAGEDAQIINTAWDGATLAEGDAQDVPIAYGFKKTRMTTQPDGEDWNEDDFNAMQFGYEAAGSF